MRLLHPQALERSLFMAHDELKVVGELNADDIRLHSDRCVISVLILILSALFMIDYFSNPQISLIFRDEGSLVSSRVLPQLAAPGSRS